MQEPIVMTEEERLLMQKVLKKHALQCSRCHQPIDELDCYCRHCGKPLRPYMGFWYDHGGIFLCTLIAGPVSLLPLWLSRKLGTGAKICWSLGILLFSAYILYALHQSYLLFKQAFSMML
ncbi:MAG: zinc ribbon domain-containing protein [Elusimicrobiaceae bacterium]|nr:zinc ribbon domain-containing protein [Elusimicrobiaceae bacterium]